eukprot:581980-Prymnesium_polylepis.1
MSARLRRPSWRVVSAGCGTCRSEPRSWCDAASRYRRRARRSRRARTRKAYGETRRPARPPRRAPAASPYRHSA